MAPSIIVINLTRIIHEIRNFKITSVFIYACLLVSCSPKNSLQINLNHDLSYEDKLPRQDVILPEFTTDANWVRFDIESELVVSGDLVLPFERCRHPKLDVCYLGVYPIFVPKVGSPSLVSITHENKLFQVSFFDRSVQRVGRDDVCDNEGFRLNVVKFQAGQPDQEWNYYFSQSYAITKIVTSYSYEDNIHKTELSRKTNTPQLKPILKFDCE